jgi:hypothetical protein
MNLSGVSPVKDQHVTITARSIGDSAVLAEFSGVLSHRDPAPLLAPFFTTLHKVLIEEGGTEVRVDIRALRFMNSASFKHFVTWIRANGSLPVGQRYRIHFVLNPQHHWQEVSIHALSCFSMDEITVEKVAPAANR